MIYKKIISVSASFQANVWLRESRAIITIPCDRREVRDMTHLDSLQLPASLLKLMRYDLNTLLP